MEYYITKYALTKGIYKVSGTENDEKTHLSVAGEMGLFFSFEYFETKIEAVEDAENRRTKRINSLNKQLGKMKEKTFIFD